MKLEGSTIIVTGASSGIGAASSRALARRGAHVVPTARRLELLNALADEIRQEGGSVSPIAADITQQDDCQRIIAHALSATGQIDGLLNNAGYLGPRVGLSEYPEAEFRRTLEVNILGTFLMTQAALTPLLKAPSGGIINMSSYLGRHGLPDCAGYVAAKFGVEGITQGVAHEVQGTHLAAISLAPGMVATDMLRSYLQEEDVSDFLPPSRVGEGVARLFAGLRPAHNGMALDLEPWLPPPENTDAPTTLAGTEEA